MYFRLLVGTISISAALAQRCGPFQISSTSGALFALSDGHQYPGDSATTADESEFFISVNGTLTNSMGQACSFNNGMTCAADIKADPRWYIGRYGALNHNGTENFNACPADSFAGGTLLAASVTITPTMTATTPTTASPPPTVVPLYYVFDNWSSRNVDLGKCHHLSLQASRCQEGEGDAASAGLPSSTPTAVYTGSGAEVRVGVSWMLSSVLIQYLLF